MTHKIKFDLTDLQHILKPRSCHEIISVTGSRTEIYCSAINHNMPTPQKWTASQQNGKKMLQIKDFQESLNNFPKLLQKLPHHMWK